MGGNGSSVAYQRHDPPAAGCSVRVVKCIRNNDVHAADAIRRDRRVTLSNAVDPENTSYQDQHDRPPGAADAADSGIAGRLSGGCSISPTRSAASIRPGAMIPSVSGETRLN
jgi:hypothetical protein